MWSCDHRLPPLHQLALSAAPVGVHMDHPGSKEEEQRGGAGGKSGWKTKATKRQAITQDEDESHRLALKGRFDALERYPWMRTPPYRLDCPIDFSLENPAFGKLWLMDCVRELYDPLYMQRYEESTDEQKQAMRERLLNVNTQFRLLGKYPCTRMVTSYCKYGLPYIKPTGILTSMSAISLRDSCTKDSPCSYLKQQGKHQTSVQEVTAKAQRNQLPKDLTKALLAAFVAKHRKRGIHVFLLVDVFSGWGSVADAAEEFAATLQPKERLIIYTNDISTRQCHTPDNAVNMGRDYAMDILLRCALMSKQKEFDDAFDARGKGPSMASLRDSAMKEGGITPSDFLKRAGISALLHCSFPCCTYSTAAGGTHRAAQSIAPRSEEARRDDKMLEELIADIVRLCQLAPPSTSLPSASSSGAGAEALVSP